MPCSRPQGFVGRRSHVPRQRYWTGWEGHTRQEGRGTLVLGIQGEDGGETCAVIDAAVTDTAYTCPYGVYWECVPWCVTRSEVDVRAGIAGRIRQGTRDDEGAHGGNARHQVGRGRLQDGEMQLLRPLRVEWGHPFVRLTL